MALGWLWWRAWAGVDGVEAAVFCVAGVALLRHPPYFHVAGVALGDMDRHFAWQAWHLWHGAGSGGVLGPEWTGWTRGFLRCRRVTFETSTLLHVAGVALGDMDRHFAWQAWHLWHWAGSCWLWWRAWAGVDGVDAAAFIFAWQAWRLVAWTCTLRGRRGTYGIWWRATYSHTQ